MKSQKAFPYSAFKKSLLVMTIALAGCNDNSSDENTIITSPKFDAADCFNPTFAQAGTTSELTYDSSNYGMPENSLTSGTTSPFVVSSIEKVINTNNLGLATFNGQQASHIKEVSTEDTISTIQDNYVQFNTDVNKSLLTLGFEEKQISSDGKFVYRTSSSTNNPSKLMRYDLNQNENYINNFQFSATSQVNPCNYLPDLGTYCPLGESSTPVTTAGTQSAKITYSGKKSVTVPAGTFTTCEFQKEESRKLNTGETINTSSTSWYAVDSGVLVKSNTSLNANASNILTLKAAKINGAPIVIK